MHGGTSGSALGVCWASTLAEGKAFTTVELKINFLRPVREGKLQAAER